VKVKINLTIDKEVKDFVKQNKINVSKILNEYVLSVLKPVINNNNASNKTNNLCIPKLQGYQATPQAQNQL